jgi:hypothetical protein
LPKIPSGCSSGALQFRGEDRDVDAICDQRTQRQQRFQSGDSAAGYNHHRPGHDHTGWGAAVVAITAMIDGPSAG